MHIFWQGYWCSEVGCVSWQGIWLYGTLYPRGSRVWPQSLITYIGRLVFLIKLLKPVIYTLKEQMNPFSRETNDLVILFLHPCKGLLYQIYSQHPVASLSTAHIYTSFLFLLSFLLPFLSFSASYFFFPLFYKQPFPGPPQHFCYSYYM